MKRAMTSVLAIGLTVGWQVWAEEAAKTEGAAPAAATAPAATTPPAAPAATPVPAEPARPAPKMVLSDDVNQLRAQERTLLRNLAMVQERMQVERDPDVVAAKKAIEAAKLAYEQRVRETLQQDAEGAQVLRDLTDVQAKLKALAPKTQPARDNRPGKERPAEPKKNRVPNPPILK